MKILFLGSSQSVFLSELAACIKKKSPEISLNVVNLTSPGGAASDHDKRAFDELIDIPHFKSGKFPFSLANFINACKGYITLTSRLTFLRNLLLLRWKSIAQLGWKVHEEDEDIEKYSKVISRFDVINLHNLTESNLRLLKYVDNQKIVLSFWGSDLMREHLPHILKLQSNSLSRAAKITVQNEDLKFLICSKFGWHLRSKIHCTTFIPNETLLLKIKSVSRLEAKQQLQTTFNFDPSKIWIILGYQTIESMQVLEALESIVNHTNNENLAFIFPSTYKKIDPEYVSQLKNICRENSYDFHFITDYLSEEHMACLRKATDIYVHLPISDAYSFTLIEHLYGGNKVVAGSWLPYSNLRLNGVKYMEVETPNEVGEIVNDILGSQNELDQTKTIDRLFSVDKLALQWIDILTK